MEKTYFISVEECCSHYHVEIDFINSLEEHGLLSPTIMDQHRYLEQDHLQRLEKFINMYYDLGINLEGIEVISRLLERIEVLQKEMRKLQGLTHE